VSGTSRTPRLCHAEKGERKGEEEKEKKRMALDYAQLRARARASHHRHRSQERNANPISGYLRDAAGKEKKKRRKKRESNHSHLELGPESNHVLFVHASLAY